MRRDADLALFAHVAGRAEHQLDLAQAALLIAEPVYPGIDVPYYVGMLDRLGDEARRRVANLDCAREGEAVARRLVRLLFEELGFSGNERDYYDPRNSYLNEVLERRVGIPITLAVVVVEVARRAGIAAEGVGFPGHFLVRLPGADGPHFVDAFSGTLLGRDGLRALHERATGVAADPPARLLAPATGRQILVRMLTNLRAIHQSRGEHDRLREVLDRLRILQPADGEIERALIAMGEPPRAIDPSRRN